MRARVAACSAGWSSVAWWQATATDSRSRPSVAQPSRAMSSPAWSGRREVDSHFAAPAKQWDDGSAMTEPVTNLLDRETYGFAQADRLLGLRSGTSRRWIDGYQRAGKHYDPVVREQSTGVEVATWGEFVETRLLAEYRDAGVPLIRMRPVIEALREELNTRYPLASARTWLRPQGQELVRQVQERVGLERRLALVVMRTGQTVAEWSTEAEDFRGSLEWSDQSDAALPERLRPVSALQEVIIDPLRGFGEPVVRGVRTEIIAELFTAGDPADMIAETYELSRPMVDEAVRYELMRRAEMPVAA